MYGASSEERRNLLTLCILMVFFTCFFALEMQLGSLLNLFADRNVDKTVFGWVIPSSFSQAINPFSIIVLGPFLASLFANLGSKMSLLRYCGGILTMAICFFLLYQSCFFPNSQGQVPYAYLFIAISFMGLGELCIGPAIQSYCTILAPEKWRGFLMGTVMLSASYANLAGILIAKFMSIPQKNSGDAASPFESLNIYQEGFYNIMLFNFVLIAIFVALVPVMKPTFDKMRAKKV